MANAPLTSQAAITDVEATDLFYVVRAGVSKKIAASNFVTGIGEGVFIVDNSGEQLLDSALDPVTLTAAAVASEIVFPHASITLVALHQPFHWWQEDDPHGTNPADVVAGHWWFKESTMVLKRRNAGDTAWDTWLS